MRSPLFLLCAVLLAGCHSDPFHADTNYPESYYNMIEKQDMDWLNNPTD